MVMSINLLYSKSDQIVETLYEQIKDVEDPR
jgi:hypothetical protein